MERDQLKCFINSGDGGGGCGSACNDGVGGGDRLGDVGYDKPLPLL